MGAGSIRIMFARELRRRQTEAEKSLWSRLKNKQLDGAKFRRQQTIGKYIVDFVNLESRVVIELDGGHHNEGETVVHDEERAVWLSGEGYNVLRFWNNEVLTNMEGVLDKIREAIWPSS